MEPKPAPTLEYSQTPEREHGIALFLAMPVVFVAHVALQFILYRGIGRWGIADSDWVVFGVPNLLALGGYGIVFGKLMVGRVWSTSAKIAVAVLLTMLAGLFSMLVGMFICVNTFGE